jgi:hypothetical protein
VPFPSFMLGISVPLWEDRLPRLSRFSILRLVFLIEIHQRLAEINQCKSIKRTELSAIPWVESNSRNLGGIYEKQNL